MEKSDGSHPDPNQLIAYAEGRLDAAGVEAVAVHLDNCPACKASVGQRTQTRVVPVPFEPLWCADVAPELAAHPRYRVLRVVGAGGMGTVSMAEDRLLNRRVAFKVISRGLLNSPEVVARFEVEAKAVARLDHSNVVRASDAERAGDLRFLVMEDVEGVNLSDYLETKGQAPGLLPGNDGKPPAHRDMKKHTANQAARITKLVASLPEALQPAPG